MAYLLCLITSQIQSSFSQLYEPLQLMSTSGFHQQPHEISLQRNSRPPTSIYRKLQKLDFEPSHKAASHWSVRPGLSGEHADVLHSIWKVLFDLDCKALGLKNELEIESGFLLWGRRRRKKKTHQFTFSTSQVSRG